MRTWKNVKPVSFDFICSGNAKLNINEFTYKDGSSLTVEDKMMTLCFFMDLLEACGYSEEKAIKRIAKIFGFSEESVMALFEREFHSIGGYKTCTLQ